MKRRFKLFQLFGLVFVMFELGAAQSVPLKVKVMNVLGQPISGVSITAESDKYLIRKKTDESGSAQLWIPDGFYRVCTESWVGKLDYKDDFYMPSGYSSYFRQACRSKITVVESSPVIIDLFLIESASVLAVNDLKKDVLSGTMSSYSHSFPHPKILTESLFFEDLTLPIDFVVQYGLRTLEKGRVVYLSVINLDQRTIFGESFPGVSLSYDRKTIYCERLDYDRRTKTFEVKGNVIVDDGNGRRKRVENGTIKIRNNGPVFSFVNKRE